MPGGLRASAFGPVGSAPGYRCHRRVGLVKRSSRPGGWITVFGGKGQAMGKQPGQRQGDGQQRPAPQSAREEYPHPQRPFVIPHHGPFAGRECSWRAGAAQWWAGQCRAAGVLPARMRSMSPRSGTRPGAA